MLDIRRLVSDVETIGITIKSRRTSYDEIELAIERTGEVVRNIDQVAASSHLIDHVPHVR